MVSTRLPHGITWLLRLAAALLLLALVIPATAQGEGRFSYWFPWLSTECPSSCNERHTYIGASCAVPANVFVDANFNGVYDQGELAASMTPSTTPTVLFENQVSGPVRLMSDQPLQGSATWIAGDWGIYEDQCHEYAPAALGARFVIPPQ